MELRVYTICPKCEQRTLPRFDNPFITAVACQNPACKHIVEKVVYLAG